MELHQLGVLEPGTGLDRQAERVTVVLVASGRRTAPDAGVTSCGQDHCVSVDQVPGPVGQVEGVGAEHSTIRREDPSDVETFEDPYTQLLGAADKGALDRQAGVIAGER